MSSSDDANWEVGESGEGSSSVPAVVRKQSLRNITPRSYSSLLKSESEDEEEDEEEYKVVKSTVKPDVAAAVKQGNQGSFLFLELKTVCFNLCI